MQKANRKPVGLFLSKSSLHKNRTFEQHSKYERPGFIGISQTYTRRDMCV